MLLNLDYEWQLRIAGQVSHWKHSAHAKDLLAGILWAKMQGSFCAGGGTVAEIDSIQFVQSECDLMFFKVHIFWEGHKILQNLHLTFDWHYKGQK